MQLLQAFINTNDVEAHRDELATPAQVASWLSLRNLATADLRLTDADRQWTVSVREALRDLIDARDKGLDATHARSVLDAAARSAGLRLSFDTHRSVLTPTRGGIRGAVGRIVATLPLAMADPDWSRLKTCHNDACRWVFYDSSRNRSSHWCTMAICGNRVKARAYRARTRGAT